MSARGRRTERAICSDMTTNGVPPGGDFAEIEERVSVLLDDPAFRPLSNSLRTYYGDGPRNLRMDALLHQFLVPDTIVFDVGSHVGDRVGSFRRARTRVVSLEPQPLCAEAIRRIYSKDPQVAVVEAACGSAVGTVQFKLNSANPTVATASDDFVAAARDADGWREQTWDGIVEVPLTTLDELIARFSRPQFVKIDVEGFEAEVLKGLSSPVPALSFEFTTIQRETANACVAHLMNLGRYRFNVSLGETHELVFEQWCEADRMRNYLGALPHAANSGDVYARLETK